METFQILRDKAKQKIKVADHMLFMTYPIVKDPKLLLSIIENVFHSLDFAMSSLLYHERLFKRLPAFHDSFQSKYQIFREKIMINYGLSPEYIKLISDVRALVNDHKSSPMSFKRKDKFVICSSNYDIKTVDINLVKKYIFESKMFIQKIDNIVSKNERIFI